MAIEINRTPVLKGDAAKAFEAGIKSTPQKVTRKHVVTAVERSKKSSLPLKSR